MASIRTKFIFALVLALSFLTACGSAGGGGSVLGGNLTEGPVDLPIILAKDIIPGVKDVTFDSDTFTISFVSQDGSCNYNAVAYVGNTADSLFDADDDCTYRYVINESNIAEGTGATTPISFVLTSASAIANDITAGMPTTLVIQHNPDGLDGYYVTVVRSNVNNLFANVSGTGKPFGFINSDDELKLFYPAVNTDGDNAIITQRVSDGYIAQLTTTSSLVNRTAYSEYASKILLVGDDNIVSYWNGTALSTNLSLSIGDDSVFSMDPKGHHVVYSKLNSENRYVLTAYVLSTATSVSLFDDDTTYDHDVIKEISSTQILISYIGLDGTSYNFHSGSLAIPLSDLGTPVGTDMTYFDDNLFSTSTEISNLRNNSLLGGFYISEGNLYYQETKVLDYTSYDISRFDMAINGSFLVLSKNTSGSSDIATSIIDVCPLPSDYSTITTNALNDDCYSDGPGYYPVTSKTHGNHLTYALLFSLNGSTQVTTRDISTTSHATPYTDIALSENGNDSFTAIVNDVGPYFYSALENISGGEAPYSCEIINSGVGTLDPDTCVVVTTQAAVNLNPTLPVIRITDAGSHTPVDITTEGGGGGENNITVDSVTCDGNSIITGTSAALAPAIGSCSNIVVTYSDAYDGTTVNNLVAQHDLAMDAYGLGLYATDGINNINYSDDISDEDTGIYRASFDALPSGGYRVMFSVEGANAENVTFYFSIP
ncbi:hypothetical protein K1X76_05550 [bacterium]|nr:hypothetical protein [bacterium]